MLCGWLRGLAVSGLVAGAGALFATPAASGYSFETPPWVVCSGAASANLTGLEYPFTHTAPTAVTVGMPVTLTVTSSVPVQFSFASTAALLSSPDIDGGAGSDQTPAAQGAHTYSFTSTKATATAGRVYYQGSFSDAGIPQCAGQTPTILKTAVHTLTVAPPVPPSAPAAGSEVPAASTSTPGGPVFSVGLNAPLSVRLRRSGFSFLVSCSRACSGSSQVTVLLVRPHGPAKHLTRFQPTATRVEINGQDGGGERITERLNSRLVAQLRSLVHSTAKLELELVASVADSQEQHASTHTIVHLSG
jgi:hypothetical protein